MSTKEAIKVHHTICMVLAQNHMQVSTEIVLLYQILEDHLHEHSMHSSGYVPSS